VFARVRGLPKKLWRNEIVARTFFADPRAGRSNPPVFFNDHIRVSVVLSGAKGIGNMVAKNRFKSWGRRWSLLCALAAAAGCSRMQSPEARIQKALAISGMKASPQYRIAGSVTIDGTPPEFKERKQHLVAVLYDPEKPDIPMANRPHTLVKADGHFTFTEDGVVPGHYVLAFAVLRRKGPGNFIGPDAINNLYNDPDVNAKDHPELVIEHKAPGKTDYEFNLEVAGKPPVTTPGPHAATNVKP
jgi:hypothetical protein